MLRTLFGELAPRRMHAASAASTAPARDDPTDGGLGVELRHPTNRLDRAISDVVVDASPAAAMRAHFAATRANLDQAGAMITLLDPSGLWASQVIRALSDAAAQHVERLALRERGTLRTLAVIERTIVPRHEQSPLKVYHADIRATGLEQEEISNALAEGSHLTAVIIGAMQPHAVEALLRSLLAATRQAEWHCPWLVFLLPPGSTALRQRILDQDWPAQVRTAAMAESLTSAAGVWNTVLTAWEAAAAGPQSGDVDAPAPLTEADPTLQAQAVERALSLVARTDGLLACGLVNLGCGDLLAADSRADSQHLLARTAAALCAAREAHIAALGPADAPPDELLITNGAHQALLRAMPQAASLGIVALIDRQHANLALLRFRLLEAEKHLV
ncbi:hypothetical protein HLB44_23090 [Aquincola sp. S2]|uniref:Uncharacterized protein n=1 Tax=Pseudaquabacterium terrae TaxID=2732868 RepID=A0ABX2EMW2_9BURK|nr:hypothetical protein [Aquabacterium terrae]NRF69895.1 hypothetical protein [Aquabacterium terrae]